MARGVEEIARLPDPDRHGQRGMDAAEWPAHPARARAARRHRHHLREPAERDGGCRRAVPEVGATPSILRGGSESRRSSAAIHACLVEGLRSAGLPEAASSSCRRRTARRSALMLAGMTECIDVIVPRGGKSLVARVQQEARVPVIGHLEGICHVYVDRDADSRWRARSW